MNKKAIVIELPANTIEFQIGSETYTASLADKSIGKINADLKAIEMHEVKMTQKQQKLVSEITDKKTAANMAFDDLDNETITTRAQLQDELNKLDNEYYKKFDKIALDQEKYAREKYLPYLDSVLGKGAGEKIYTQTGNSMINVAKIVSTINIEINRQTNIQDYNTNYLDKIAKLNQKEE